MDKNCQSNVEKFYLLEGAYQGSLWAVVTSCLSFLL